MSSSFGQPVAREDLVAHSLLSFFETSETNRKMYMRFRKESIRPRILEFWFLRYCCTRNICVPRPCDGVLTPVSVLYRQHLASFHKQFFSITRIPRRDRTNEIVLGMTIDGKDYQHTLAEWNVIRFLLEDGATVLMRFLQDRRDVENACRIHRKHGSSANTAPRSKKNRHQHHDDEQKIREAVELDAAVCVSDRV
jgi:hypothetical protein